MAFKKVGGSRVYYKYSELSDGDTLIEGGTYLGSEEGKYGVVHLFQVDSETHCLNSAGQLNYLIDKYVAPGTRCRIVYCGKEVLTKGPMTGKESHKFGLEVDDGAGDTPPNDPAPVQVAPPKPTQAAPVAAAAKPKQVIPKSVTTKRKAVNAAPFVPVGDDIEL
jgi:hypothetical protein